MAGTSKQTVSHVLRDREQLIARGRGLVTTRFDAAASSEQDLEAVLTERR